MVASRSFRMIVRNASAGHYIETQAMLPNRNIMMKNSGTLAIIYLTISS